MYSRSSKSAETLPNEKKRNPIDCDKCGITNRIVNLRKKFFKPKSQSCPKNEYNKNAPWTFKVKPKKKQPKHCVFKKVFKHESCPSLTTIFKNLKLKVRNISVEELKLKKRQVPWYQPEKVPHTAATFKKNICRFFCFPKIMVTIPGTSITRYKIIRKLINDGATSFHFNISYGSQRMHRKIKEHLKEAIFHSIEACTSLVIEITSRKLRTGIMRKNQSAVLERGSIAYLTSDRQFSTQCTHNIIFINFADYIKRLLPNDIIVIGESINLVVLDVIKTNLVCKVLNEGLLESNMPVKLPLLKTIMPFNELTMEEMADIYEAVNLSANIILLPCFNAFKIIEYIKRMNGSEYIEIFAKITDDTELTGNQISSIISNYNGIFYCANNTYKNDSLIQSCLSHHLKIVWAHTSSLKQVHKVEDQRPAKRLCLFTDTICIKPELVKPGEMKLQIKELCPDINDQNFRVSCIFLSRNSSHPRTDLIRNILHNLLRTKSTCIVIINDNGIICKELAKLRPHVQIIATFICEDIACRMATLRNVRPLIYDELDFELTPVSWKEELQCRLEISVDYAAKMEFINKSEPFMFVYPSQRDLSYCDIFKILNKSLD